MRILVIEDDSRAASFIRRGLSADKFLVDIAHDGQNGLERLPVVVTFQSPQGQTGKSGEPAGWKAYPT